MSTGFNSADVTVSGLRADDTDLAGTLEGRSVVDLVESQAVIRPDSLAVSCGAAALTYKELNERADELACVLVSRGVDREAVVGLCMPRSLGMIVTALGVFKSGAAYLPLDPTNPPERLAFMLHNSQASVVITEASLACSFSSAASTIVLLDGEGRLRSHESARNQGRKPLAKNLAYVIYTSGSSGRPKGVEVTHKNLLNLVDWHCDAFGVSSADRASHLAGIGFDASVWEIWPYLAKGASVHIVDRRIAQNPEALRDWMISERISIAFAPTVLAEQMISLDWQGAALRVLLTGASVLQRHPSKKLPFRFVNNYGLTECTVVSTSGDVGVNGHGNSLPPIGKPIASTQVYILDEHLSPVAQGVAGEIYVGGEGVARGYCNAAELTEARFIPDPFKKNPQARLYRTGDLGKFLPDGQIAYLGRIDQQIKIRGFRIEPEEIASILNQHPAVRASVVNGHEFGQEKETRLIGYIVPKENSIPAADDLQKYLRSFLPDYMIPSTFVLLESLPLTANGKIDLAALPVPQQGNTLRSHPSAEEDSALEHRVAGILAQLLGLEKVGRDDNFFFLGGHSLLGMQLVTRLRDVFGVELSLKGLFDHPTVKQLSGEIEQLLVAELKALSEEEAEKRLNSMMESGEEG
jgi:amino acid adenylation domain-containing protein